MNSVKFNKKLYSKGHILTAICDYDHIADIVLSENADYYVCGFRNTKYNMEKTKKEFANYLIEIQNSRSS